MIVTEMLVNVTMQYSDSGNMTLFTYLRAIILLGEIVPYISWQTMSVALR